MKLPDGYVFIPRLKNLTTIEVEQRDLVMCKSCWKHGLDNCPMEFYWDSHPADDVCYCAMGERKEDNDGNDHDPAGNN